MAISYEVFKNVSTVTLGSHSIYGVQTISVQRTSGVVSASADADAFQTVAEPTVTSVTGTITLVDPAIADTLQGLSNRTLSFVAKNTRGAADDTVTIVHVSIVSVGDSVGHAQSSSASVSFVAYSDDGTTDPVSRV
jgi:hypothetical protein